MKFKKLLAITLACLMLSGCAEETPVESPDNAPQASAQTVVLPKPEQTEQRPEEEPTESTAPTETSISILLKVAFLPAPSPSTVPLF